MKNIETTTASRRQTIGLSLLAGASVVLPELAFAGAREATPRFSGNPLRLPAGVCDPQIRVYGSTLWLYATHDASPTNTNFAMNDW